MLHSATRVYILYLTQPDKLFIVRKTNRAFATLCSPANARIIGRLHERAGNEHAESCAMRMLSSSIFACAPAHTEWTGE